MELDVKTFIDNNSICVASTLSFAYCQPCNCKMNLLLHIHLVNICVLFKVSIYFLTFSYREFDYLS